MANGPLDPMIERVSVRRGLGGERRCRDAAGNLVLDDDRLPEQLRQVLADQAREDVRTLPGGMERRAG